MKQMIIKVIKSEKGSGLVLALMVLLVLSVLGSALGVVTVGSHRLADINRDSTSAYYIAEAGANMAYEKIKKEVEILGTNPNKKGKDFIDEVDLLVEFIHFPDFGEDYFEEQSGVTPTATIKVINENERTIEENIFSKEYLIQSTGNIDGKNRKVYKKFTVSWEEKESVIKIPIYPKDSNAAITIVNKDSTLFLRNNSKVIGDIFHNLENISYGPGQGKKDEILTGKEYGIELFNHEDIENYVEDIFSNLNLLDNDENFVIEGDVTINKNIDKNLIVKGNLIIDKKAEITGNVIVKGTVTMENHTKVYGSIISSGNVVINNQAQVTYDELAFARLPSHSNSEVGHNIDKLIESKPTVEK